MRLVSTYRPIDHLIIQYISLRNNDDLSKLSRPNQNNISPVNYTVGLQENVDRF